MGCRGVGGRSRGGGRGRGGGVGGRGEGVKGTIAETTLTFTKMLTLGLNTSLSIFSSTNNFCLITVE